MNSLVSLLSPFLVLLIFKFLIAVNSAENDDPSTWPGHLEPLGSQNEKLSLETVHSFPSPQDFFSKYVSTITPLLIKGGAKLSPAFSKWTDEYFKSLPEAKKYTVVAEQGKKENRTNPAQDLAFYDFVDTYKKKDIYMVHGVLPFLQKDVILPPSLQCEDITDNMLVDTVMWFSSGGTKSVLHNDDVDNINCLFSGTKELVFIDYKKYNKKVKIDHPSGGYSGVDVDRVDFTKYPGLRDVQVYHVAMEPGDCLFIPYKWFHQVRSYDRNIAVNVWFTHKPGFEPQKCDPALNKEPETLDKFKFSVLEAQAKGEEQGPVDLMEYFAGFLKELDDEEMTLEMFVQRMKNDEVLMGNGKYKWNEKFSNVIQNMFGVLDSNKDGVFSSSDMEKIVNDKEVVDELENLSAEIEDLIEDQNEPNLANDKDKLTDQTNEKREEL
ncbi:tRNA wybutosine-synthesizing protein 5-like [Actinia tenebrosa]|uniref:tRNA wybutosine-synthesizing protein 5-like n=1 Tax=Actinia tenebrosa TaxID=6105 RepID=A0A6P8IL35_ACTTE|nr:tRNA wybutosine-synthesizing protein 5-like [Actinia tenebrosa]